MFASDAKNEIQMLS